MGERERVFKEDPIKQAMYSIIFYDLKRKYSEWIYIGGSEEKFKNDPDHKSRILVIEHVAGLSIEEAFNE